MIKEIFFNNDKYRKTFEGKKFTVKKDGVRYYTLSTGGSGGTFLNPFVLAKNSTFTITDTVLIGTILFYVFDPGSGGHNPYEFVSFNRRNLVVASDVVLQNRGVLNSLLNHVYQLFTRIFRKELVACLENY